MNSIAVVVLIVGLAVYASPAPNAEPKKAASAPYCTAKFSPYADIDNVQQLKAVYDFYFPNPNSVPLVLSAINSLMAQTAEFGPHDFDPLKIVVVSHGPELVVFAKRNYAKYKETVDRAASLAQQGVRFEICRGAAAALNFVPEDFHGFTTVVPSGPYALSYWQMKGYGLIPGGLTDPQRYTNSFNKNDIPRRPSAEKKSAKAK
ncbi:MAG: DsrE family protein [Pseudomonadota bacterium]|nr:DsrE family protein [Pseudomonadota bacterium]